MHPGMTQKQPESIPSAYLPGREEACQLDKVATDNYIAHTQIGDPVMDAIVEELAPLPQNHIHRFIEAGMNGDHDDLQNAPKLLREFFICPPPKPEWLDYDAFRSGTRAFQRNARFILPAFVTGVLIDGFSTLISQSFAQTGRIFDNGVWRLKQNNRHQLEIFWPDGLKKYGDGWKLSVRIRFVHAQVRRLLDQTNEWDHKAWGVPISAAHTAYATACFATRALDYSKLLGARYNTEERASYHAVWRYTGHLMGVPETILFTNESDSQKLYQIGGQCEPPPTQEAIITANALINSAPLVAGITDTNERKKLVDKVIYPVARGLVGKKLADELKFPKNKIPFPLLSFRLNQKIQGLKIKLRKESSSTNFAALLEASAYHEAGVSYRLPNHAHAERSGKW